jgi:hypothetical protein
VRQKVPVEELQELLQLQSSSEEEREEETFEDETMMKVSYCPYIGIATKKTLRLQASYMLNSSQGLSG